MRPRIYSDDDFGRAVVLRPPITLPEVSILKKPHIEPLLAFKRDRKERDIDTLERNKPKLNEIIARLKENAFPGVTGFRYVPSTYGLTITYVAMSVQWYAHRDLLYVQEGNAKKRHMLCDIGTFLHKLEGGRRNFQ